MNGVDSGQARVYAVRGVPDQPTGVLGVGGDRQAVVSWVAPVDAGRVPVVSYTATASPGGAACVWTSGPLACTIVGLTNGVAYTFVVTATNADGVSVASVGSSAVTPVAAASAPVSSDVVSGPNPPGISATVTQSSGSLVTFVTSARPGFVRQVGTTQTRVRRFGARAAATRICSGAKMKVGAKRVRMVCVLTAAVRRYLKTHTLSVTITTTFTPVGGGARSVRSRDFVLRKHS